MAHEFKELERLRSKARHDEAQALRHRSLEIAKNLLAEGVDVNAIARSTRLTIDDILRLK